MGITLAEAQKRVGKGRSTLLRHIAEGRVSASKDSTSRWIVEESELARAYPEAFSLTDKEPAKGKSGGVPMGSSVGRRGETAGELAVRVEMLTEQIERERKEKADLRDELRDVREELRTSQNKLTGLLEAPRRAESPKSWADIWRRLWPKADR